MVSTRILFVDDHEIFRESISQLFSINESMEIIAMAANGQQAVQMVRDHAPDIVVMDISMPQLNGIAATRQILHETPKAKIIALSGHTDEALIADAFKAGIRGYVPKDGAFSELVEAIETVLSGNVYISPIVSGSFIDSYLRMYEREQAEQPDRLTRREKEVVRLVAEGLNTKEIAFTLSVSTKTVETHRSQAMKKLDIVSMADLIKYALREGLTSLSA